MTTTIMRDSVVGDDWIRQTMANVPVQKRIDPTTGNFNGEILTGPVRLGFPNLHTPQKKDNGELVYGAALLFPPGVDLSILYEEYWKVCGASFPEYYDQASGQYHGLHNPFHDQAEKCSQYKGYTPGAFFLSSTSKFQPSICDPHFNPIVDPNAVKAGYWAICVVKAYAYGKQPVRPKKGVAFGLQSVMIIGQDTTFGGGQVDAKKAFAGVNIQAPVVRPNIGQGMPSGPGAMPPATPPAPGIPGYTAPGGGVIRPGVAAPTPQVPQTHWQPPAPPAAAAVDDIANDPMFQ